jgi:hypothetical protein
MRRLGLARHHTSLIKKPSISREICAAEHVRSRLVTSCVVYLFLMLLGVAGEAFAQPSATRLVVFFGGASDLVWAQSLLAPEDPSKTISAGPGTPPRASDPNLHEAWISADVWSPEVGVVPSDLAPLRQVEELLGTARTRARDLDEDGALRSLAQAQRLAWDALAVPGAAAFCAEVELQLAVTAAQAGRWDLAADSLARAARLDGPRRLLAAEASPEVVALADRVFRDAAAGSEGEIPISTDAERARIFIDDVDRGVAPQRVRMRVGTHALRIEAEGRLPYYSRIEVAQGVRPAQRFFLAPDPRALAKTRVTAALAADSATLTAATSALLTAAPELIAIVWVESDSRSTRKLIQRCGIAGCDEPVRVEHARLEQRPTMRLTPETLRAARTWLHRDARVALASERASETAWWRRWYVWTVATAIVVGASAAVAVASEPAPTRSLRVIVDSGDLR